MLQARTHVSVVSGRLPQPQSSGVEIALTPETAAALQVQVGSVITLTLSLLNLPSPSPGQVSFYDLPVQVVGFFTPGANDLFWHGETFQPNPHPKLTQYPALMSSETFLASLTQMAATLGSGEVIFLEKPDLRWYYHLDASRMKSDALDDLIDRLTTTQIQLPNDPRVTEYAYAPQLSGATLESFGAPSLLERYRDRLLVARIPIGMLLLQVLALACFFVSMVATLLIDAQAEAIALLRSRGARRRQILGAFVAQSLGLSLLACLTGPVLAVALVYVLGRQTLAPASQTALHLITDHPFQAAFGLRWFALVAAGGALLALLMAVRGAANRDILALRQEQARSTHRPLWQRLYLDLAAALVALTGYGLSSYVAQAGVVDARVTQLILSPLALVAPLFLALAGILLFPRLFPWLLARLSRRVARQSGAAPVLALAQMARAPQQALRLILLLTLAISFAGVTLVLTASQSQQMRNMAAYQVGADFSGGLPPAPACLSSEGLPRRVTCPTLAQQAALYRMIPGITAATIGYAADAVSETIPVKIRAVDPASFAQAAIWSEQDAAEPLAALMASLVAHRSLQGHVIPAIVDAQTWNALHLRVGAMFSLDVPTGTQGEVPFTSLFLVLSEVHHLPTVNDSLDSTSDYTPPGGILVDEVTYAAHYQQASQTRLPRNYVWLRTSDDPLLLAGVRAALTSGPLRLEALNDHRALVANAQQDPLYLDLIGVLTMGAAMSVLLALVGSLLTSWLSARMRLKSFALLRALGSTPRQIASVLFWEQGLVYLTALGLGALFGAFLVMTLVPELIFTSPPATDVPISRGEFYALQHLLSIQIVLPAVLSIALTALVVICLFALAMMARLVSKPALSQILRLNED